MGRDGTGLPGAARTFVATHGCKLNQAQITTDFASWAGFGAVNIPAVRGPWRFAGTDRTAFCEGFRRRISL
ncbi:hypothetical protein MCHIJ_10990 [Mycolicibacterium chitae]|nr:hypothetical protein MCHIJ_10990 [Mycolicibacterium chitae]